MSPEEMAAAVRRYVDAYNRCDVDAMLVDVHPHVEFVNLVAGRVNASASGIDELRRLAEAATRLFAEREQAILALDMRPEGVQLDVAFRGRLAADLPPHWRRGQEVRMPGRSEFHFRDGLIDRIVDVS